MLTCRRGIRSTPTPGGTHISMTTQGFAGYRAISTGGNCWDLSPPTSGAHTACTPPDVRLNMNYPSATAGRAGPRISLIYCDALTPRQPGILDVQELPTVCSMDALTHGSTPSQLHRAAHCKASRLCRVQDGSLWHRIALSHWERRPYLTWGWTGWRVRGRLHAFLHTRVGVAIAVLHTSCNPFVWCSLQRI